ncbi:hypothetical protein [Myroides sp. DF42-4-2]|uniref:hypothetical protein n=1 Tax=Myroides sp. DF42-4-2 TaxID=2746726 RepID=UPI0025782B34|nr:hypothetical protein [Myroides sp. DF42-4-2]MDM1409029.1 hypothetical protein [Myroides sp. DF42-4-2]
MMEKKEQIKRIASVIGPILEKRIDFKNIDELLDERDHESFSAMWISEFNKVEKIKRQGENDLLIDTLREEIFKSVFNKSNNSDVASYISDDLALLMDAVHSNYESAWLSALLNLYIEGEIPKGKIEEKKTSLLSLIEKLKE